MTDTSPNPLSEVSVASDPPADEAPATAAVSGEAAPPTPETPPAAEPEPQSDPDREGRKLK